MSDGQVVLNRSQANGLKWVCRKCPTWLSPPMAVLRALESRDLIQESKDPNLPWEVTALGNATMSRYEQANPGHRIPATPRPTR